MSGSSAAAQALERHPADALRLYLLQTHYRSPLEFSEEGLAETEAAIVRMYETLHREPTPTSPAGATMEA